MPGQEKKHDKPTYKGFSKNKTEPSRADEHIFTDLLRSHKKQTPKGQREWRRFGHEIWSWAHVKFSRHATPAIREFWQFLSRSYSANTRLWHGGAAVLLAMLVLGLVSYQDQSTPADQADIAEADGQVQGSNDGATANTLPEETPPFPILFPVDDDPEDFQIVRVSPNDSEPAFAYVLQLQDNGPDVQITQQLRPESFNAEKTAEDFQATDIIQIDGEKIYHGFSERGGVQSLVFEKDGLLILIRSPIKYSDDVWAQFYLNLELKVAV